MNLLGVGPGGGRPALGASLLEGLPVTRSGGSMSQLEGRSMSAMGFIDTRFSQGVPGALSEDSRALSGVQSSLGFNPAPRGGAGGMGGGGQKAGNTQTLPMLANSSAGAR